MLHTHPGLAVTTVLVCRARCTAEVVVVQAAPLVAANIDDFAIPHFPLVDRDFLIVIIVTRECFGAGKEFGCEAVDRMATLG